MAYKKYIKVGGKKYGPYYYESYRDKETGKVKKRYVSEGSSVEKDVGAKKFLSGKFFQYLFALIFLGVLIFFAFSFTGMIFFDKDYDSSMTGSFEFFLKEGELLPENAVVILSKNGEKNEFFISDLFSINAEGDYFIEGFNLSGNGRGVGFSTKTYPNVSFKFRIIDVNESFIDDGNESGIGVIIGDDLDDEGGAIDEGFVDGDNASKEGLSDENNDTNEAVDDDVFDEVDEDTSSEINESDRLGEEGGDDANNDSIDNVFDDGGGDESIEDSVDDGLIGGDFTESVTENSDSLGISLMTGMSIRKTSDGVIDGVIIGEDDFLYEIGQGKGVEIIEGSVLADGEIIEDSYISFSVVNGEAIFLSRYYLDRGFGEGALGDEVYSFKINFSDLGISARDEDVNIKLVYDEIVLLDKNISFDFSELEIIKNMLDLHLGYNTDLSINLDEYFSGAVYYEVNNLSSINLEVSENKLHIGTKNDSARSLVRVKAFSDEAFLEQFFIVFTGAQSETIQHGAIINRPVKWTKIIDVNASDFIEIPLDAFNVSVKTGEDARVAEREAREKKGDLRSEFDTNEKKIIISGNAVLRDNKKRGFLSRLFLTGRVVEGNEIEIIKEEDRKIINISDIADGESDVVVEYETPAPLSREEEYRFGKKVIVYSEKEYNYTDILAYSLLENVIGYENKELIRVYHFNEGRRSAVDFEAFDLDEDGMIDYIEWVVPHLSEQVYEIIYITKAEHLDENRSFIEDVFEEVGELDGMYKLIPDGDFLRVTFEQNLTNKKDITIYARAGCNESILINGVEVPCDVYFKKLRLEEMRQEEEYE
jgi:hypothetical protein